MPEYLKSLMYKNVMHEKVRKPIYGNTYTCKQEYAQWLNKSAHSHQSNSRQSEYQEEIIILFKKGR